MARALRPVLFVVCATIALILVLISPNLAGEAVSEKTQLSLRGFGPILVGMTIPQAEIAGGLRLSQVNSGGEPECLYFQAKRLPQVSFMVTDSKIARIDIDNPNITTLSGAKIGDPERKIKAIYGSAIVQEPHPYVTRGHYLVFVPRDRTDKNYRVIFETEGRVVTRYRSGKLPEVGYIEGCA